MIPVFLASAIVFGTPGPIQRKTYNDSVVSAEIAYRIAPDKFYGSGEAGAAPAISTGTLTYRWNGRRYSFDLATVLPIVEHHVDLPDTPQNGCGAAQALARRGTYLAVEFLYAEKGCMPSITLIELSSGTIVTKASLDWTWSHRFDVTRPRFNAVTGHVKSVDTIALRKVDLTFTAQAAVNYLPWTFRVLHWTDDRGENKLLAYEVISASLTGKPDPGAALAPKPGETIAVGTFGPPAYAPFDFAAFVRLDADQNRRYAALQPPTSLADEHLALRGKWLDVSNQRAADGDLAGAVGALEKMLDYEDNDRFMKSESESVATCRVYIPIAAKQHLSKSAIVTLWSNGCKPQR